MVAMLEDLILFVAGLLVWTFLEYLIHGWLSHTFRTFATPLHAVHHGDAHAVFTVRAWMPIAAAWMVLVLLFRWTQGTILFSGLLAGFVVYEIAHYRFHFSRPRGPIEEYLRSRHLVHHDRYPDRCFGVTSAIWDLVFGTEPMGAEMTALCESMRSRPPLTGRTNLYKLKHYILPFSLIASVARRSRTK
jgi:sterol desaturase/sphingolipid hydroxylase (fatty acid hydroxylase superfamily)